VVPGDSPDIGTRTPRGSGDQAGSWASGSGPTAGKDDNTLIRFADPNLHDPLILTLKSADGHHAASVKGK